MDPITAIAGIISIIGGISSILGGSKASKAAKKQGKLEAAAERRVTAEKIFQLNKEERRLAGTTRAVAVGSGVKANIGSPLTILAEQARAFGRERALVAEVGATKAQSAIAGARNVGRQARYQGFAAGSQGISSGLQLFI